MVFSTGEVGARAYTTHRSVKVADRAVPQATVQGLAQ